MAKSGGTADSGNPEATDHTGPVSRRTKAPSEEMPRCGWCRRVLPERKKGPGRPRRFCSQACRQWQWVARHRAAELKLSEDELVMARSELDRLHDDLYVLACAVDDTERDLAAGDYTRNDLVDMLEWLLEAAKPLRDRELSAPSG